MRRDRKNRRSYQQQLTELLDKKHKHHFIGVLPKDRRLEVGDIGRLVAGRAKILQVIDKSNAIAETEWYTLTRRARTLQGGGQTVDTVNQERNETVWLKLPTTRGMRDGRIHETEQVFDVIGTHTYQTAAGSNTVLVLEALEATDGEIESAIAALAAVEEKKAEELLWRTWSSADGKFRVDAKFVGFIDGKVQIEKRDGRKVNVSSSQLSKEDQAYFRAELKRRAGR